MGSSDLIPIICVIYVFLSCEKLVVAYIFETWRQMCSERQNFSKSWYCHNLLVIQIYCRVNAKNCGAACKKSINIG